MSEEQKRFERQTAWQKSLYTLPWPEKIRMAKKVRESVKQLRATPISKKNVHPPTQKPTSPKGHPDAYSCPTIYPKIYPK